MTVTLNIENDVELRAYIKECMKNQVLSITRDELKAIIVEELSRKIKGLDKKRFDTMIRDAMKDTISDILYNEYGVHRWSNDYIQPYVDKVVAEAIKGKDWNKLVDTLAKEKVKALLG